MNNIITKMGNIVKKKKIYIYILDKYSLNYEKN